MVCNCIDFSENTFILMTVLIVRNNYEYVRYFLKLSHVNTQFTTTTSVTCMYILIQWLASVTIWIIGIHIFEKYITLFLEVLSLRENDIFSSINNFTFVSLPIRRLISNA